MLNLFRFLRLLLALLGAVVFLVTCTPLVYWWAARSCRNWTGERTGTMIVLGGSSMGEDYVGHDAYLRAIYAARYFREGRFQRVVLTGTGTGPMRRLLLAYGVPDDMILMETAAKSTHENALFTAKILAGTAGPRVLVTSDYHVPRACRTFRKSGQDVLPLPVPDALKRAGWWLARWPAFLDLLSETAKTAYYSARGWI